MQLHKVIHEELIGWGIFLKDVPFEELDTDPKIAIRMMAKRIHDNLGYVEPLTVSKASYERIRMKCRYLEEKYEKEPVNVPGRKPLRIATKP